MYEFILIVIILIGFIFLVSIPILIGYLIYRLIKRKFKVKYANIFAIIYSLLFFLFILYQIYEDELFTKNEATELVEDLGFKLNDDFEIIENKSNEGMESMTHTFILKISNNDRNRLINEIKTSKNYMPDSIFSTDKIVYPDRYKGKKIVWNYEDESWYIRHYYQPNDEGYAPTDRSISISKTSNELRFEDVNE